MTGMSVRTAAAWAIGSQYASFAIGFVTSAVLARWFITPADLGLFSIAFSAVTLLAFLQDFGVNRYINGERELTELKLRTAFTISVAFAWAIALLCILAAWPIATFYGDPRLLPVTLVIAASYLLVPLAIVPQAMCQRRMDFRSNTMIEVGAALANAGITLPLAMAGHGAIALAWGAFAQQAARLIISQWRAGLMLPWPLRLGEPRPVLEIGTTNSLLSVNGSVNARAPELVIGRLIDSHAVGLFTRASGLALQLRLLVAGAVTGVFYPAFRQVRDKGEPLGPPYLRVVAAYTGITWPAMAGIAVLAAPLIRIVYGERWLGAAPLLVWVALAQLCYVSLPLNTDLPVLLGRTRALIRRNAAEIAASIGLLALAAPFGLRWVAFSRFVHALVSIAIYAPLLRRILGFDWGELARIHAKSAVATLAAVAPLLVSYAVWCGPAGAGPGQAIGGTLTGILCWFAALNLLDHPLRAEILAMLGELRTMLPPRRPAIDPHR